MIVLSTALGDITVELDAERAPKTVENFLQYVDDGHLDGTIFHRVIPGFMIQGGGFTESMQQKPIRDPVQNEADNGLKNKRGTIAMARTQDINSATSQFFLNLADNGMLDHGSRDFGYAVFGKVTAGMDVVDQIAAVATGTLAGHQDVPMQAVTITAVRRA